MNKSQEARFDDEFQLKEFGIKCGLHSPCRNFNCIKSFITEMQAEAVIEERKRILEELPKERATHSATDQDHD